MNMIRIESVSKTYNTNTNNAYKALDNVSIDINKNEIVAIMGESGAGKTTLLNLIACIDAPDEGKIIVDGENIIDYNDNQRSRYRNEKFGIIMQEFMLINDYYVHENIILPLLFNKSKENYEIKKKKVYEAAEMTGIRHLINKRAYQLSGGEKQRVAISRAMINSPKLLLADEPTGALDSQNSEKIISLFRSIRDRGVTIVIITHSKDIANYCDRTIYIKDGQIV